VGDPQALADAIADVVSSHACWARLSEGAVRTIDAADGWDSLAKAAASAYGITSATVMPSGAHHWRNTG